MSCDSPGGVCATSSRCLKRLHVAQQILSRLSTRCEDKSEPCCRCQWQILGVVECKSQAASSLQRYAYWYSTESSTASLFALSCSKLTLYLRHACSFQVAHIYSSVHTDLNLHSMKLWGQYPDLAAFPGSLILDDDRTGDNAYPSSPLTPEQLKEEEPKLSDAACQGGARMYKPEGMQQLQTCCFARQHAALNAWAALFASSADWVLSYCAICAAYATYSRISKNAFPDLLMPRPPQHASLPNYMSYKMFERL